VKDRRGWRSRNVLRDDEANRRGGPDVRARGGADELSSSVCGPRKLWSRALYPFRERLVQLGWTRGRQRTRRRLVLVGNFWFPADAAGHEGGPSVPRGKVLLAFSDFPVVGTYAHWRRVTHLRIPSKHPTTKRLVAWHVRFAGRAVFIEVRFGSRPSFRMWRLANSKLETVHRKQR